MKTYDKEVRVAKDLGLRAWNAIAPIYDQIVQFERKGDGSPVTQADKRSNQLIVRGLTEAFPLDSIVSEEEGVETRGDRAWYIDPIDGTKGFIKRNGHFAIHIGLCENQTPVCGVVYWPVAQEMYLGVVGDGAWRENSRGIFTLDASRNKRIENLVASSNGDFPTKELESTFRALGVTEYQNTGSEGLRLLKIAEGIADIRMSEYEKGASTWDVCAPQAIVEAAGGTVRNLDGSKIIYHLQGRMSQRYVAAKNEELVRKAIEQYNSSSRESA